MLLKLLHDLLGLETCLTIAAIVGFVQLGVALRVINEHTRGASYILVLSIACCLILGLGPFIFGPKAERLDFSLEYGPLISKHVVLVSFEERKVQGDNRISGRGTLLLCHEDHTRYGGSGYLRMPKELQPRHSADVNEIVFIRKEHEVVGSYFSKKPMRPAAPGTPYGTLHGLPAKRTTLRVSVVDVASATLVAVVRIEAAPPPEISTNLSGDDGTGDMEADGLLSLWIAGKCPIGRTVVKLGDCAGNALSTLPVQ